ncbi:TPA: HlyC/CorC family transporter [Candidatus Poribacteria bacterium]|nr:HlyC/CorC family transporter [Candidatus Poribacteria bacterium]
MTPNLDDPSSILQISQVVSLVLLSIIAFFSSVVDTTLKRLTKNDILEVAEAGGRAYHSLRSLLQKPRQYIATIAILKCVSILGIVFVFMLLVGFNSWKTCAISLIASGLVIILFTELIPRNYALGSVSKSIPQILLILRVIYVIFFPLTVILSVLAYFGTRAIGGIVDSDHQFVSSEVLQAIENVGDSSEILEPDEREMISRILDLPDKVTREIMIARTDMVCLDVSSEQEEILQIAIESRHSRIPVYEENVDHVIGVLPVKGILDYLAEDQPVDIKSLIANHPPFFAPETKKIWDLFQDLQANKQHIAIVVDEYGGTAGMVTLEDIIEEVVGEIQDEYDLDEQMECTQVGDHLFSVDARMGVDDFNTQFGIEIEVENVDTVGGFIVNHLGEVPVIGTDFSSHNLTFTILEADNRRIHRIQVESSRLDNSESV